MTNRRRPSVLLTCAVLVFSLAACGAGPSTVAAPSSTAVENHGQSTVSDDPGESSPQSRNWRICLAGIYVDRYIAAGDETEAYLALRTMLQRSADTFIGDPDRCRYPKVGYSGFVCISWELAHMAIHARPALRAKLADEIEASIFSRASANFDEPAAAHDTEPSGGYRTAELCVSRSVGNDPGLLRDRFAKSR